MYLKKLEIQGFKSFADKTVFEFRPGITTVIGPNGSGKSNVSDSIRWVLGEQRAKSLRGGKMEDIIFTGTQNRKALNFAEVTITFDNSTGNKLPVNFSEVAVTRRVYRSGESEYFINKSACRLKDIIELFMGTGIGRDGYSIIGQGRIDEILSNNSEERRNVFEEAAGISKYKARKIEAEKKLEATCQNLMRINDILKELENQIGPLKIQSEKAEQYLLIRDELKVYEINMFLHDSEKIKSLLSQTETHLLELQEELKEKTKNSEESLKQKDALKEKNDEILKLIDETKQLIFKKQTEIEKSNTKTKLLDEKTSNNKLTISHFESEIQENVSKINELKEEKNQKNSKLEKLVSQKQTYVTYLKEKEDELNKIIQNLDEEDRRVEAIKTDMIDFMNEKSDIKSKMNSTLTMKYNSENRNEQLDNKLINISSENDRLRMKQEDNLENISKLSANLKRLSAEFKVSKDKEIQLESDIKAIEKKNFDLSSSIAVKKGKHKFLSDTEKNNEGYFRSVKGLLDECEKNASFKKGIHGSLAQLITVPKEYEIAIEIVLGSNLQNIVTETQEDAKKAIDFLKEKSLGRATFLPISAFKQNDNIKNIDTISSNEGFIGIASKLVTADPMYSNILESLLGKTVIVDTLNNAISMSKKVIGNIRIVSLEGDVVNTGGTMSGGSVKVKADGILSRGRIISELEEEIKNLNSELEASNNKLNALMGDYTLAKQLTEKLSQDFRNVEIEHTKAREQITALEKELQQNEEKVKSIKTEKSQLHDQITEFTREISEFETKISKLDEKISNIQVKVDEYKQNNKSQMEIRDNLSLDITNYKVSLSSFDESELSINEFLGRIDNDIYNAEEIISKRTASIKKLTDEINNFSIEKTKSLSDISEIENNIASDNLKLTELESKKVDITSQLETLEKLMGDDIRSVEETKEKISKEEMKKMKIELDFENINAKIWEDYQITYSAALELKKDDLGNPSKISSTISSLKNKIRDLGSINIDSIEEYKKINERFNFMSKQKNDLTDSEQKLRKVIEEMIATMKKEFMDKFSVISENFKVVFAELFNGGTANIKLCDESNVLESGIDIEVQPPGKKLQNMMLLSGGERALTAIALLFSILKINPSPFCVLDEIEAALDDVNVYRFADYVKKFSDSIQFIIITHRKGTMEAADTIYGITMEERGISKLVSMKLD